jgi:predicted phosphate transport protein (TIGR00153 family)
MLKRLLPKEYSFFDFFEAHAQCTILTCRELLELTSGRGDLEAHVLKIKDLEHEGDRITTQCIEALQKTFITPIERTDIHQLIKRLDDVVDIINGASYRVLLYELNEMRPEARELAHILVLSAGEIDGALKALRNLKNVRLIKERCQAIYDLEGQGDEVLRSALMRLIKEDQPMVFIKWKEIFERLEKAINRCKDVADLIEEIVIAST